MDILVMLEENPDHSPVLAHVNSVPSPTATDRPARDIVTLYGVPSAETLALALAAAVESRRTGEGHNNVDAIRHLGVSTERRKSPEDRKPAGAASGPWGARST